MAAYLASSPSSVFMAFAILIVATESACPERCKCDTVNKVIDCHGAGLVAIPYDLPDPSGLKRLDLSGNKISGLVAHIVSYMNLEVLDLSDNQMISIDDNVLDSLPRLKYLYLQDNHISSINTRTFKNLKALLKLDLNHNRLSQVNGGVFADMSSLEDLSLAGNNINDISDNAFLGLEKLQSLNLDDNQLTSVPMRALDHTKSLDSLSLNFNHIDTITSHAFEQQRALRTLSMESNKLGFISENAFHDRENSDLPQLEMLVLKGNNLKNVPTTSLERLSNLARLDLSGNPIERIGADAFKGLHRLQFIYLNAMPTLETVQKFAFSEMTSLKHVEMHSNRALKTIEEGAFTASTNIEYLDLHACGLESLSPNTFSWEDFTTLDLRFNPWVCDCHMQWLRSVLGSLPNNTISMKVACVAPAHLSGRLFLDIPTEDFMCERDREHQFKDHVMLAIFASFSAILVLAMLVLFYRGGYFGCKKDRQNDYKRYQNHSDPHIAPHLADQAEHMDIVQNGQAVNAV